MINVEKLNVLLKVKKNTIMPTLIPLFLLNTVLEVLPNAMKLEKKMIASQNEKEEVKCTIVEDIIMYLGYMKINYTSVY